MKKKTFEEFFEEARKGQEYWVTYAKLDFTEDLYRLMEEKGLKKADLAKKINKSSAYITKVFKGNVNFTLETMVRLVSALDGRLKIQIETERTKDVQRKTKEETSKPKLISRWQLLADRINAPNIAMTGWQTPDVLAPIIRTKAERTWDVQKVTWHNEILTFPKPISSFSGGRKIAGYAYATA